MTDYWPDQDGRIADGFTIGFCETESASVVANGFVKRPSTTTAGKLLVTVSSTDGDAWGVALKTPVAIGDKIPVLFYGVVKLLVCAGLDTSVNPYVGSMVTNSITNTIRGCKPAVADLMGMAGAGLKYNLGMALQGATVGTADEILVLVGKCL